MLVTDAQVHIWEVDRIDRPWPKPLRNQPQLPNGFAAAEMIAQMDAAGVDRAVIVPPTWIGENNSTAIEASLAYPGRFATMGRFDPMRPDYLDALSTWRKQPDMLGIRMTFRVPPYDQWLISDQIDHFWKACEHYGIPVMCLVPGEAEKLEPIAQKFPDLSLIVDHMACDLSAKGDAAFANNAALLALAKYPKVSVKTSSAPCFSTEPFPFRDIYGHLKQIIEAFGPQRCMWGADFTRLTSTYPECLEHFKSGLDFLSESDKEWILGRSTAEILGWPEG